MSLTHSDGPIGPRSAFTLSKAANRVGLVSISSTFYTQMFSTNVVSAAYMYIEKAVVMTFVRKMCT